jgi:hypothetical protein
MSGVTEGIWFPIAYNHNLHHPINDQSADNGQHQPQSNFDHILFVGL